MCECERDSFHQNIKFLFVRFVSSSSGERVPPLSEEDLLPRYVPRVGESEPVKRARLLYQSRYIEYAWPNHHHAELLLMFALNLI